MKNIKILAAAAVTLMTLAACSSDGDNTSSTEGRLPILLSANADAQITRAGTDLQNTQFKKGKNIDVQITSRDNLTGYDLLTYFTSDNAGTLQPSRGVFPYYPVNQSHVDIRAVYPTGYMNASQFSVQTISQTSSDAYMNSDLMFAKVEDVAPSSEVVQLTFEHKMTKIVVSLTGEGGVNLTGSTVKLLGVKTATAFNPQTGEVTTAGATGSASDITMTNDGAEPSAAIIVPQVKPSGYLLEIVLANNDVLHYKTVQDIIFDTGKVYTFNVKVIESNISVSTTVSEWDTTPEDVEERLKL
ncbi:MAG: fimbrillin family protein [Prevotella sp.]|nr:fimbrillin family protein [Prevotella sp.]